MSKQPLSKLAKRSYVSGILRPQVGSGHFNDDLMSLGPGYGIGV